MREGKGKGRGGEGGGGEGGGGAYYLGNNRSHLYTVHIY